jgi:hypothetical protein
VCLRFPSLFRKEPAIHFSIIKAAADARLAIAPPAAPPTLGGTSKGGRMQPGCGASNSTACGQHGVCAAPEDGGGAWECRCDHAWVGSNCDEEYTTRLGSAWVISWVTLSAAFACAALLACLLLTQRIFLRRGGADSGVRLSLCPPWSWPSVGARSLSTAMLAAALRCAYESARGISFPPNIFADVVRRFRPLPQRHHDS